MTRDDKPVAPLLEYPSASPSPYDRPVEPFVQFARRFKLAVRFLYLAFALLVIGFAVWGILRMTSIIDPYSQ